MDGGGRTKVEPESRTTGPTELFFAVKMLYLEQNSLLKDQLTL